MKKSNVSLSVKGSKRGLKNKTRMKRRQKEHEALFPFLNKVLQKYGSVWSYDYSKQMRDKKIEDAS